MPTSSLGFVLGTAFAAGLNVYATVATLGLLHRFGTITLPESLQPLAHPLILGIALLFYVVEFVADKIPAVDHVWDVIHTFIRPPAAAILSFAAVSGVDEPWRIGAALIAGTVALASHGGKASARLAVNTSPEPFSTWGVSFGETSSRSRSRGSRPRTRRSRSGLRSPSRRPRSGWSGFCTGWRSGWRRGSGRPDT